MMEKFDNIDRKHVINEVERIFSLPLSRVGRRHIYFKNEKDARFVILGGNENWHGIPDDVITDILKATEKYLIIGLKKRNSIRVYYCDITNLLTQLKLLNRPGNDKYTFNIDEHGTWATIRQVQSVKLNLLAEIQYTSLDREKIIQKERIQRELEQMTTEELEELIRKIHNGELGKHRDT